MPQYKCSAFSIKNLHILENFCILKEKKFSKHKSCGTIFKISKPESANFSSIFVGVNNTATMPACDHFKEQSF